MITSNQSPTRRWLSRVPFLRRSTAPASVVATDGATLAPPRGARAMAIFRWSLLGVLSLCAITMGLDYVGVLHIHRQMLHAGGYTCAMHPTYQSDKPGDCPICGMTLVPREQVAPVAAAKSTPAAMTSMPTASAAPAPAAATAPANLVPVHLTTERIQRLGMRTARVTREAIGQELRIVGFVTPDESRLHRVQIRVSGWVRRLYVNQTGEAVTRGAPLLSLYSPTLYQAEQEYVLVARASQVTDSTGAMLRQARHRLELLGVPDNEIRRLSRTNEPSDELVLTSPSSGYVLEKQVLEGQFIDASTSLLTVADLSSVWLLGDVYEQDLPRVHAGQPVRLTVAAAPGRVFSGRVDFVYPTVSLSTRTLKVRVAFSNPGLALRPGMYGDVRVVTSAAPQLVVPQEAVVRTGENTYVFLALPGGRFEPRLVRPGAQQDDRVAILSGLVEGDLVVTSGNFLLDSESRLRASTGGTNSMPGMKMDDTPAPASNAAHAGHGR